MVHTSIPLQKQEQEMEYKVKTPPSTPISIPTTILFTPSTLSSSSSSPPRSSSPCTPPPSQLSPDSNNLDNDDCAPRTPLVILTPCAACKILRRRCVENCVLAPYFPPTDPYKFTMAHRVFGASNIIKFLQDLPESHREDAVSSIVYEASARIRDPVYGCAGAICQLQKQVSDLQEQLARAQADLVNLQCQQPNLVELIRMSQFQEPSAFWRQQFEVDASSLFVDGCSLSSGDWPESLWPLS